MRGTAEEPLIERTAVDAAVWPTAGGEGLNWLPTPKRAAVCFTVDDVHPAPVALEALSHVRWLQDRHRQLQVTLFTTPDWRAIDPYPKPTPLYRIPFLREHIFNVPVHPPGTFRLDRHDAFCASLREWSGAEIALHGLYHVRTGSRPGLEFAGRSRAQCRVAIEVAMKIFERADLPIVRGMSPPGWHAPGELLRAMHDTGLAFIASARDLDTPIAAGAVASGSGIRGVSLIRPQAIEPGLLHFPTNFQATSTIDRAVAILECGGLLSIKAHLLARLGSYVALDGLTPQYRDSLDRLFSTIEDRFGEDVWWTTMGGIAS